MSREQETTRAKQQETKPFRLRPEGKHHVPDPDSETGYRRVQPGEIVRLTATQAKAFADHFEPA